MTFHALVPSQCTTGMKYAFGVSIIRLRGIAGEPGIAVGTVLARLNPLHQRRHLRALVPPQRDIYAGKS
jgi:hypothetical protein